MAKSRSEIQKAYRERQKAKGDAFLTKERLRQRQYYTPAAALSDKKRKERNFNNKLRNRLSRYRKSQAASVPVNESSGYESASENLDQSTEEIDENQSVDEQPGPSRLVVKLPIQRSANKSQGLKKSKGRALARANKKIKTLEAKNDFLRKKVKILDRKIARMTKRNDILNRNDKAELTPKKQTQKEVNELGLTPTRTRNVAQKLLIANTVMAEISEARKSTSAKKRKPLYNIVSGKITKKYRCLSHIERATGLSRKTLAKTADKDLVTITTIESRACISKSLKALVVEFLTRDDNSRVQPGKADAKKVESGEKEQTRVLTDYMKNIYDKFMSENPAVVMSLTTFQRMRPKNILLTSFIARNTCQCVHHQNMALKVQAIKNSGIKIGNNPESLIAQQDDLDNLLANLPEKVNYKVWKKVEIDQGKMRMKIVDQECDTNTFREDFKTQLKGFAEHVHRVHEQYVQVRTLKDNLPDDEMMLQMDFAENYACRSLNEIQTAYWNQSMVTLHPIVAYYKESGNLKHQSFVVVSDEMSHSAGTVCAFLDKVMPCLKLIKSDLKNIHYWTDSPSSQYRNRYIFHTLSIHQSVYQVGARWNYFEVGHGKGPCDGLGGTVKRMADEAIKQGHTVIQDAEEFFGWASNSSMKGVKFLFVSKTETQIKHDAMKSIETKFLKGTMKLHAIGIAADNVSFMTRQTSCYCNICLSGEYCNTWLKQTITAKKSQNSTKTNVTNENVIATASKSKDVHIEASETTNKVNDYKLDDPVAVMYDGQWYVGKIVDKDLEEGDYEVTFMTRAKRMYKWPQSEDRIWVDHDEILCQVYSLAPSGKSRRLFKLSDEEIEKIKDIFEAKKPN